MKKTLLVVIPALLLSATSAGSAAPTRTDTAEYTIANGASVGHGDVGDPEIHWSLGAEYARFRAVRGERSVMLEIVDESGMTASGHVHIDLDADGKLDRQHDFCGATSKPLAVRPGAIVEVGTIFGTCDDGSPSIVTEGTITATFAK